MKILYKFLITILLIIFSFVVIYKVYNFLILIPDLNDDKQHKSSDISKSKLIQIEKQNFVVLLDSGQILKFENNSLKNVQFISNPIISLSVYQDQLFTLIESEEKLQINLYQFKNQLFNQEQSIKLDLSILNSILKKQQVQLIGNQILLNSNFLLPIDANLQANIDSIVEILQKKVLTKQDLLNLSDHEMPAWDYVSRGYCSNYVFANDKEIEIKIFDCLSDDQLITNRVDFFVNHQSNQFVFLQIIDFDGELMLLVYEPVKQDSDDILLLLVDSDFEIVSKKLLNKIILIDALIDQQKILILKQQEKKLNLRLLQ